MPEWAEVKINSEFVNSIINNSKTIEIEKSNRARFNAQIDFDISNLKMQCTSRGKELQIIFTSTYTTKKLTFLLGMTGNFTNAETKHWKLKLILDDNIIYFDDPRCFARWEWRDWSPTRSFDPVNEFDQWKKSLISTKHTNLYEFLMDQQYNSGVGNYLAAEIIGRLDINPWTNPNIILQNNDAKNEFCNLVKNTMYESYILGGAELYTWKNPTNDSNHEKWEKWMKYYNNTIDCERYKAPNGRTLWAAKKWKTLCPWKI